jgi:nucleotide-binding universal stress UspA family protein
MSGPIERVVVTLDATSENHAAIDTAARLAARARAPLHGLFVEDQDLLHLAGLPFARQVTHGGATHPMKAEDIELDLRAAAERARRELLAAAKRHRVKGSFAVARTNSAGALAEIGERDLMVAGTLTRPVAGHFRVECRWWSSVAVAQGPVLMTRHAWGGAGTIVMLLRNRAPASERLLAAAAQLAEAENTRLTVICPPALAGSQAFEKWLAERAGTARLRIEVAPDEPVALHRLVAELDCRLLAIEADNAEGRIGGLRDLAERFACDLLIVR